MKKVQYEYDLTYPSRSGKYGFETFHKENDKLYYFHFNDSNGNAILFSRGYRDSRSRDNTMKKVVKNAPHTDRYLKKRTEEGKHYFYLKTEHGHKIARSMDFDSERVIDSMIKKLSEVDHDLLESDVTEITAPVSQLKPADENKRTELRRRQKMIPEDMPRFRFTLTYYPDSRFWFLKNDFSEEDSMTLPSLEGEKIVQFIHTQMPEWAMSGKEEKSEVRRKSKGSPIHKIKEKLEFKTKDGRLMRHLIPKNQFSQVIMKLGEDILKGMKAVNCEAKIFAKSLTDHKKMLIGELEDGLPVDGRIEVPVLAQLLKPGIYRLYAQITLKDEHQDYEEVDGGSQIVTIS